MGSTILPEPVIGEPIPSEGLRRATEALAEFIETSPDKVSGVPVLKGTRFPLAQLLAQLADGDSLHDVAENFDLAPDQLSGVLHALGTYFDQPVGT